MKRHLSAACFLLVACSPSSTSTGGPYQVDAGPPLCDGCEPCDGGTSRDGGACRRGCWDGDLCAILSNSLTCGEHGVVCAQCVKGTVCDAGSCVESSP